MCTSMFIAVLFTIAKVWKQPKCPYMNEWEKKYLRYIYRYRQIYTCAYIYRYTMEYYSAFKKKEILLFMTTWMNLQCIMLNEIHQAEKDKY